MEHLLPIIEQAETLVRQTGRCILALDGMAAAGKTTAAKYLAARWNTPVVHMDDFFLPPELRTEKRLTQPGGNIHYERFTEEVLPALKTNTPFSYRAFDCSAMTYGKTQSIPAAPLVIVEGAYSMHPFFEQYWDMAVFFTVTPEEQKRRIIARGGEEIWPAFRNRWIPMEHAYHAAFGTRSRADIIL